MSDSRPIGVVLGDALDELREREARLSKIVAQARAERDEVRKAIRTLERAGGKPNGNPANRSDRANPRGEVRQQVIEVLRGSLEPLDVKQLAERVDRDAGAWFYALLKRMVGAGELVEVEGGYGVPAPPISPEPFTGAAS